MPTQQTSILCQNCHQLRLHTRNVPNHLVHALVSLFLCGLWLPIWIIVAIVSTEPFRCNMCGVINTHRLPPTAGGRFAKSGPTDWQHILRVVGIVIGVVGLLLIIGFYLNGSLSTRKANKSTQSTPPPVIQAPPVGVTIRNAIKTGQRVTFIHQETAPDLLTTESYILADCKSRKFRILRWATYRQGRQMGESTKDADLEKSDPKMSLWIKDACR